MPPVEGKKDTLPKDFSVREMIRKNKSSQKTLQIVEKIIPKLLLLCAVLSILVTFGIFYTLISETFIFFSDVNFFDYILGTRWSPWNGAFGVLPLITGTLLITVIAMIVAVPVGIASAIFLSEYASDRVRRIIKPILEVLAGIPTIVYGFFALTFVTPLLQSILGLFQQELSFFNALSAGIVVGVMIIPMVASLSEDAMSSVPNALREGALALGATRLEVTFRVVLPAAFSGIVASFVLAISRAIGETMIVSVAAGATPKFTFDPTLSIQTMTGYIVQVFTGDATYGSTIYYSVYAVGMTLFVFTLIMNLLAQFISRRFREEY